MSDEMCNICCTKTTSKMCKCPFCCYEFCLGCFKKYIGMSNNMNIQCMSCGVVYLYATLQQLLPMSFMKTEYPRRLKELLFKREELLIPQSVEHAYMLKEIRESDKKIRSLAIRLKEMRKKLKSKNVSKIHRLIDNDIEADDVFGVHERAYVELYREKLKIFERILYISNKMRLDPVSQSKKCPECSKGYLNQEGVCYSCDAVVCERCLASVVGKLDHSCDMDMINTVETIQKDSKPCPKCSIFISKQEGCDQMFCVNCKICFDWKTLNVIDKNVQNPHYFEELRKHKKAIPLEFNDEACAIPVKRYVSTYKSFEKRFAGFDLSCINEVIGRYAKLCFHKNSIENKDYSIHNYHEQLKKARMLYIIEEYTKKAYMKSLYDIERMHNATEAAYKQVIAYRNIFNVMIMTLFNTLVKYQHEEGFGQKLKDKRFQNRVIGIMNSHIEVYNSCLMDIKNEFSLMNVKLYELKTIKVI